MKKITMITCNAAIHARAYSFFSSFCFPLSSFFLIFSLSSSFLFSISFLLFLSIFRVETPKNSRISTATELIIRIRNLVSAIPDFRIFRNLDFGDLHTEGGQIKQIFFSGGALGPSQWPILLRFRLFVRRSCYGPSPWYRPGGCGDRSVGALVLEIREGSWNYLKALQCSSASFCMISEQGVCPMASIFVAV